MTVEAYASLFAGMALISIPVTWLALRKETKALHHTVMISCIGRFQDIVDDLAAIAKLGEGIDLTADQQGVVRQYLDLCNEELFYFQNRYLPTEVEVEWLDGMLEFIPLRETAAPKEAGKVYFTSTASVEQQGGYFSSLAFWSIVNSYPRLKAVFEASSACWNKIEQSSDDKMKALVIAQLRRQIRRYHHAAPYRQALTRWEFLSSRLSRALP